jgi:maltose-binding protein MalE
MQAPKRLAIAALVVCALTPGMAGVTHARNTGASSSPPALHAGVTIHVGDYWTDSKTDPDRAVVTALAKTWEKKTHVKVVFDGPFSRDKFLTAAPAGQAPDLIGVPHDQVSTLYAGKTLAPVPEWAWTTAEKRQYIKAAIQATTLAGKSYSMPWSIETTGLFYNKALVPASFFKPAAGNKYITWSQVINKARSLTDLSANKLGIAWDITNFYFSYAVVSEAGGYVFKYTKKGYDWRRIGLDSPGAIRGLEFLKNLTTTGKYNLIPSSITYDTAAGLYRQGKVALWLTGPWEESGMKQAGIKFGFTPVPSLDGKHQSHPFSGVQVFAVNAFSNHKNEAFAFLSYITRAMQVPEFRATGRIPVLQSVLASKPLQKDPITRGLAAAALGAQPMPNIPEMQQVWPPMAAALSALVQGQVSATDAAHVAVKTIQADIAKAHGG